MSRSAALPSAVPSFRPGGDFSLGAEEELMLVDGSGMLTDAGPALLSELEGAPAGAASACGELFACQVEFGTPVVADGWGVAQALREARATVAALDRRAVAIAVHPKAAFGDVTTVPCVRYDAVTAEFAGLLRTPTAAYQVHVGMPDTAALVAAFRGLRHHLALFRALAAGSPFWNGADSGLTSARAALMWSYPRVGVPPAFGSYAEYEAIIHQLVAAAGAPDYSYVWWDLRPQPRLGTLELRVMDVVASLDLVAGLAALAQGLARDAVERPPSVDLPVDVLRENDFRAVRYGLDARIVDEDGRHRPIRELAEEAVARARAVLDADGLAGPLDAVVRSLGRETEYERQRRVACRSGLHGVVADLARRTEPTTGWHRLRLARQTASPGR